MSLPIELAPHALQNAASARAVRVTALPTNAQTFGSGGLVRIQVPRRPRAYLIPSGTFLRFDVQIANGASNAQATYANATGTPFATAFTFDGHASAAISQLATYHNSTQLEVILGYNRLYNILLESQTNREQKNGIGQFAISGGANDSRAVANIIASPGVLMLPGTTSAPNTYTFCIPLISSLFGAGQTNNKYIPLDRLNSDLILELTLADFRDAFKVWYQQSSGAAWTTAVPTGQAAAAATISINNMQLVGQLVELDSDAQASYNAIHRSAEIELAVTQYRGYVSSLSAPLSAASVLVPARFQSLTSLTWAFYNNANIGDLSSGAISWRNRANLSTVTYRVGSLQYPPRPIDCGNTSAEIFMELEKSLRSVSATNGMVAFTRDEYTADIGAGAFVGMQELAVFPFAQGTTAAGVNTLAQNMFIDFVFNSSGLPASQTYNIWAWAQFDAKLLIDGTGSLRVVY